MSDDLIESQRRRHEGTFVRLRPIRRGDAGTTLEWRLSKRAALLNGGARTVDEQAAWISARPAKELNFIIETIPSHLAVGMLSLVDIDLVARRAEPARFLIGEERAVRGVPVAAEALLLLYDLAFDALRLHELHGTVAEDNAAMLKWHRYLGVRETGPLPGEVRINGKQQALMGILVTQEDYRAVVRPRLGRLVALARM
jgi:RimJ/RimL family protein N-acetyltransferase